MQINLVIRSNEPDNVWNAFRFAVAALGSGHDVETFLLGDGVEAPDLEHESINPRGMMRKYLRDGGHLAACGSCMDSRNLESHELRPHGTMEDMVRIVEEGDRILTF